jgi:hypothetical protein
MNKRQLIAEIQKLNPSAQEAFLTQFEERELDLYLVMLQADRAKRARAGAAPDGGEQQARLAS